MGPAPGCEGRLSQHPQAAMPPASQHGVKKAWNVLEEGKLEDGPRGQLSTEDLICRSRQGTGAP